MAAMKGTSWLAVGGRGDWRDRLSGMETVPPLEDRWARHLPWRTFLTEGSEGYSRMFHMKCFKLGKRLTSNDCTTLHEDQTDWERRETLLLREHLWPCLRNILVRRKFLNWDWMSCCSEGVGGVRHQATPLTEPWEVGDVRTVQNIMFLSGLR